MLKLTLGPDCLESQVCNLLAIWPWASYLTSVCLSFLIYKMETIGRLLHGVAVRGKCL